MLNKNAGRLIKIVAIVMFVLACISALVILISEIRRSNEYGMLLALAVVVGQFVLSALIYGFGQLIEDTMECKKCLKHLNGENKAAHKELYIKLSKGSSKPNSAAPPDNPNIINCPKCNSLNMGDRETCWNCGTEFTKE